MLREAYLTVKERARFSLTDPSSDVSMSRQPETGSGRLFTARSGPRRPIDVRFQCICEASVSECAGCNCVTDVCCLLFNVVPSRDSLHGPGN